MSKAIPAFGLFSSEEIVFLNKVAEEQWKIPITSMGTPLGNGFIENLPFRDDVIIPTLFIGTKFLDKDDLLCYQKVRDSRNCKIVICLQENAKKRRFFTAENWPDYFLNTTSGELMKAEVSLVHYKTL